MTGTKNASTEHIERGREQRLDPRSAAREGCAMQWNGQSGVREFRLAPGAGPDSHAPDEEPRRVCIGEICEPMS